MIAAVSVVAETNANFLEENKVLRKFIVLNFSLESFRVIKE